MANKFRADNQSMFADLKALAQTEEYLKKENSDIRAVNKELESQYLQLKD